MFAPQDTTKTIQKNPQITLPEEVKFYVGSDEQKQFFIQDDNTKIKITRSLKDIVENSDLFKEEDRKRFIFE